MHLNTPWAAVTWLPRAPRRVDHPFGAGVVIGWVELPPLTGFPAHVLTGDERSRAARMRDALEAQRYLASHALLRTVLATLCDRPPESLVLAADASGKPRLADAPLCFSLSRSGDTVLIGLSATGDVGVDVERRAAVPELDALAASTLSAAEYREWAGLPARLRRDAFLDCWVRKEACLKATGDGLSTPLPRVDVGFAGREPTRATFATPASERTHAATLATLQLSPDVAAAAAVIDTAL
jgi:4'-phosphopantetheinyl transferase